MTREDKDSIVEMLAKIPVTETKGSLLSAIGKLLRVIDISENSIMIPTLLKDKCEFDAYEMLTLAKILKASILGHNDLVEFYLSESSSQFPNDFLAHHQQQQQQQQLMLGNNLHTATATATTTTTIISNNNNSNSSITNGGRHLCHHNSSSNTSSSSSGLGSSGHHNHQNHMAMTLTHLNPIHQLSATPSLRSSASESTSSTPSTPSPNHAESIGSSTSNSGNGRNSGSHGQGSNQAAQLKRIQLGANGDPDATVRLLLQIEHLKVFIPHVTGIFESIVELYKNSIDTITS